MAITPVGGMIYANQNMQVAASKQTDFQARLDAQGVAATVAANEEEKKVQDVRPTEETHKIDPEKEHQREKSDEETGANEEQILSKENAKEEEEEEKKSSLDDDLGHNLDIKI